MLATSHERSNVLVELLQRTAATVHCLVRVGNDFKKSSRISDEVQYARARLRQNLERYNLFKLCDPMRIYPVVVGDLAQPNLGMSASAFQSLGERVDAIYHCGAYVHSLYPYSKLRNANVCGTIEILRLAVARCARGSGSADDAAGESKGAGARGQRLRQRRARARSDDSTPVGNGLASPVFYVSSLSVFPGSGDTVCDDASTYALPLSCLSKLGEGYAQTKVVAERLVVAAGRRGIPVKIFRPGRIVGHSATGATSVEDTFCRIIQGCLQMGAAPNLD